MIISNQQIRSVLQLTNPAKRDPAPGEHREDTVEFTPGRAAASSISDREIRNVRIKSLRELLSSDCYTVPDDMLADKMIGRALCDQVSKLYEGRPTIR